MKRASAIAGIGGVAFGVLTFVGLVLINPPGGNYKLSNVTDYLKHGHRVAVFAGLYVEIFAVFGLILLLAHLRNTVPEAWRRVYWTLSTIAAGGLATGWAVMASGAIARAVGGSSVVVSPTTTYLISEIGAAIVWGPGAVFLALALLTLAATHVGLPAWVRWETLVLGVIGLASPAFFPSFGLLIWGILTGVWLLVSRTSAATANP